MKVLIGCECSGALRSRFRMAGHEAWSVDHKEAEDDSEDDEEDGAEDMDEEKA